MLSKIYAVIGASFGDEGKGAITDYIAHSDLWSGFLKGVVILHNGGPQRAHTVQLSDGFRHVFRHFGSGTLAGADTYFADTFVVNPILFHQEYEILQKTHIKMPFFYMDKNCLFTTFFDMLVNQAREIQRGAVNKHGSCGLGVFETMCRAQTGTIKIKEQIIKPYGMTVGEFASLSTLSKYNFLESLRELYTYKRINQTKLAKMPDHLEKALYSDIAIENFINDFNYMMERVILVDGPARIWDYDVAIFESGQGLLLDQNNEEYFPYLTPSQTGLDNPIRILERIGQTNIPIHAVFVTRTYVTRHGIGRLDRECNKREFGENIIDLTNVPNPFQDSLRYAHLDWKELHSRMLKHCLDATKGSSIIIVPEIAVTHMDEYSGNPWPDYIKPKYLGFGPSRSRIMTTVQLY